MVSLGKMNMSSTYYHFKKKGLQKEIVLVDKLLTNALIEARSCERFKLLSEGLEDPYFQKFYHSFMVSEAGHYRLFMDLAKIYQSESYVKKRWEEFLQFEKALMNRIELRGDRMH